MLPPLASDLLEANPHFAKLYKHLTSHVLEADGSSKVNTTVYDTARNDVRKAREEAQIDGILIQSLKEIAILEHSTLSTEQQRQRRQRPRIEHHGKKAVAASTSRYVQSDQITNALPADLKVLVYVMYSYLHETLIKRGPSSLPDDTDELMAEEVTLFRHRLQEISAALSSHIVDSEQHLARLASIPDRVRSEQQQQSQTSSRTTHSRPPPATTSSSRLPQRTSAASSTATAAPTPGDTPPSSLSSILAAQRAQQTLHAESTLPQLLETTTSSLLSLLAQHEAHIAGRIRRLEQTTHGVESRHMVSRALFLRSVAEGIALKTTIQALTRRKTVYGDEDVVTALGNAYASLSGEERRLEDRERRLEALLAEYEVCDGGEDRMRTLGKRYAQLEQDVSTVKRDVEKLERELVDGKAPK